MRGKSREAILGWERHEEDRALEHSPLKFPCSVQSRAWRRLRIRLTA